MNLYSKSISFIKEKFFPIHAGEWSKFFILTSICFIVCMIYAILRNIKETLIITEPEMGIHAIPFIRTWLLMPLAFLVIKAYAYLSARLSQSHIFYIFIFSFCLYFIAFISVFYPYKSAFTWDHAGNFLANYYFLSPFSKIVQYWSFSIYYCISEIWGTFIVVIWFWGMCNRSNTLDQAKRFYSGILLITNLSGFCASQLSLMVSQGEIKYLLFPNLDKWGATLSTLTLLVCLAIFIVVLLYFCLQKYVLKNSELHHTKPKKEEMSLTNVVKYVISTIKCRPLAIMVFSIFFCMGVMELVWKYYLHQLYHEANEFNDALNAATLYISIFSTLIAIFVSGSLIRRFSWQICAILTPLVLFIPLLYFLVVYCFEYNRTDYISSLCFIGGLYYILSRICKFTIFDLSKEIAYMAFSVEEQIKTKAVVDGMIQKVGKASDALFLQGIILFFAEIHSAIIAIVLMVGGIQFFWTYSIPVRNNSKSEVHV